MNKQRIPLAIIHKELNKAIGSTSIGNISERDNRLEIGWTWLGVDHQGTGTVDLIRRGFFTLRTSAQRIGGQNGRFVHKDTHIITDSSDI